MPSKPTVLITGATSGIGLSAATQLTAAGWDVLVTGRDPERAERAAAQSGGRALTLDVTDAASIAAAAAEVERLDALVNNAGVQPDYGIPLLEATAEVMATAYATNVFGVVAVTNALLPALRRGGTGRARIVNVSSGTASFGWSTGPNPQFDHEAAAASGGRFAVYRSSKAALNALTLFYDQALAPEGIGVFALAPARGKTNLNPAMERGGDAAEGAAGIVTLLGLPADAPSGRLYAYDGTIAPW